MYSAEYSNARYKYAPGMHLNPRVWQVIRGESHGGVGPR
jgi:hypothetical protein